MFDELRKNTKTVLWITVVAFILLMFFAWGAEFSLGKKGGPKTGEIGRVNGAPIAGSMYERLLQQRRETYRQQSGGKELDDRTDLSLRSSTWTSLLQQEILDQEAKRLGFTASDDEVVAAVLNSPQPEVMQSPNFQTNGQFDLAKYQAAIRGLDDMTLRSLEANARAGIPATKLQQMVMASAIVGDDELWDAYRLQNDKLKVSYLLVPSEKYPVDPASVAASDVERYYQTHKKVFEAPPQALLQYVSFPKKSTETDSLTILDQMRTAIQEWKDGEDFLVVVDSYSEGPATQRGGANAAFSPIDPLAPAVREAARTLPIGQVSDVLVEPSGFHVIRVEDRKDENGSTLVKLADLYMPLRPTPETLEAMRQEAANFRDDASKRSFTDAAAEAKLTVKETGPFHPKGFVATLGTFPELQQWAFAASEGAVSPPFERYDSWVVAKLDKRFGRRVPEFSEVQDRARQMAADSLKLEQAVQAAQPLLSRAQAGESLDALSKSDPTFVFQTAEQVNRVGFVAGVGRDPILLGTLFNAPLGVVPKVIKTARGAVIAQVLEKTDSERGAFEAQKESYRQRVTSQRQQEALTAWMETLQSSAKVEDYRFGTYE